MESINWVNTSNRFFETKVQGQDIVFVEDGGKLRAAKVIGEQVTPLILRGFPINLDTAADRRATRNLLVDSFFQIAGPVLEVIPRANNPLNGGGTPLPEDIPNNLPAFSKWLEENSNEGTLVLNKKIGDEGAKILAEFLPRSSVQGVFLEKGGFGVEGAIALFKALSKSQITHFSSNGNPLGLDAMKVLAENLPESKVTKLDLSSASIGVAEVKVLANALTRSNVCQLYLDYNSIGDEGAKTLAKVMANAFHPTLSMRPALSVSSNKIGSGGAKALADGLSRSDLVEFTLKGNPIGDEGLIAIAKALPLTQIVELDLWEIDLGNKGIQALADSLPRSNVEVLSFYASSIQIPGIQALADALTKSKVRKISLGANLVDKGLGDDGVKILADALPRANVEDLEFNYCKFESDGAKALAAILSKSPLRRLGLVGNEIDTTGVKALIDALPRSMLDELELIGCGPVEFHGTIASALSDALPRSLCQSLNFEFKGQSDPQEVKTLLDTLPQSCVRSFYIDGDKELRDLSKSADQFIEDNNGKSEVLEKHVKENQYSQIKQLLDQEASLSPIRGRRFLRDAIETAIAQKMKDLLGLLLSYNPAILTPLDYKLLVDQAKKLNNQTFVDLLSNTATKVAEEVAATAAAKALIPNNWRCPISLEIFYDPVFTADGHTYERELIEKHLATHDTSPTTGLALPTFPGSTVINKTLTPNFAVKGAIAEFIEKNPDVHLEEKMYFPESSKKNLLEALNTNNVAKVKELLEKDRRLLNRKLDEHWNPLESACCESVEMLETVIKAYLKRSVVTQLMCEFAASDLGQEGVVRLLNLLPKEPNWPGLRGSLFEAIKSSDGSDYALVLLDLGVSPDTKNEKGTPALHYAIKYSRNKVVDRLLLRGANTKIKDSQGRTSIEFAKEMEDRPDLTDITADYIRRKKFEVKAQPLLQRIDSQGAKINSLEQVIQDLQQRITTLEKK